MTMERPDRDAWHHKGAKWLSEMGDCTRRKVGALIVGPDKRFWGMGYNGTRPGEPGCLEGSCPRGRHYLDDPDGHWWEACEDGCHHDDCHGCGRQKFCGDGPCAESLCICGEPWPCGGFCGGCGEAWPCGSTVPPGSSYDTGPGACNSGHAETNAKADALRRGGGDLEGCIMYVSCAPCDGCIRDIRTTTKIAMIKWPDGEHTFP